MVIKMREQEEMKKVSYFYCYSPRLRKFLDQNGTRWVGRDVHHKTKKTFWVFEQSTRLSNLLIQYNKEKSNSQ